MSNGMKWRRHLSLALGLLLFGVAGFGLARHRVFAVPRAQSLAQNDRLEYLNRWAGVEVMQYPNDLITYQEIIVEQEPDWIVETGTSAGGLTLYLSSVLHSVKPEARILTVDIDPTKWRATNAALTNPSLRRLLDRIEFVEGSSTAPEVIERIKARIGTEGRVMVILDSLHTRDHVLRELELYGELVSPGSYLILTDTHLDAHTGRPGPKAALELFLPEHPELVPDTDRDRFMISAVFGGFSASGSDEHGSHEEGLPPEPLEPWPAAMEGALAGPGRGSDRQRTRSVTHLAYRDPDSRSDGGSRRRT